MRIPYATKEGNRRTSMCLKRLVRLAPFVLAATVAVLPQSQAQTDNGWLNLTVIHTNDIHARLDPVNDLGVSCSAEDIASGHCYGGAARHKTLIQQLRQGKQHSLLLDGGDEFQGTLFYTYYKGNVTSEVMNDLGYDLSTVGNHEWDDGPGVVASFWQKLNMPVVCANIDFSKHPDLANLVKPYHIFEDLGVAIIGYITPTTGDISNSGPTISFTDPIVAVQQYIDELQGKGFKRILALSHNGYASDMDLAAKTRGLDLIVGGHSHSYLGDPSNPLSKGPYPTVIKNLDGENTLVVQAYCWGRFIGNLDVSFDPDGKIVAWSGAPVQVENNIAGDPTLLQKVDGWRNQFEAWAQTVLGQATDNLDMVGCGTRDCHMGNFVADAMLQHVRDQNPESGLGYGFGLDLGLDFEFGLDRKQPQHQQPWADVTLINSGGIRAGIPKGDITVEEIVTVAPFGNYIYQVPMKGQELLDSLEAVVTGRRNDTGKLVTSFVQVSGLRFSFDSSLRNPTTTGNKHSSVVKAEVQDRLKRWRRILPDQTYQVVTTDFVLNGGDNILVQQNRADTIQFAKQDEILQAEVKKMQLVKPYLDGRIRDVAVTLVAKRRLDRGEWPQGMPEHMKHMYPAGMEQMQDEYRRLQG
ncbi:Metallo-dependent phosphatase-like protein [Dissophora ornata]|nr:Metallo-dependent phosphatase-like protein [Dissophora ornata]